ncbi:MAG: MerR family transcriptional regulator [Mycobacteriales bacterium]
MPVPSEGAREPSGGQQPGQEVRIAMTGPDPYVPSPLHRPRPVARGQQGVLFDAPSDSRDPAGELGYRGPTACSAAGITYRQLDYWARTGLVSPSVRPASGSGTQRLYSFRDILVLKVVKRLLEAGVSLHNIRCAVDYLRAHGAGDLSRITLISDGTTVYECRSPEEVVDLLQGGQGVFGIAVGQVARQVEGELADLPAERASGASKAPGGGAEPMSSDELSQRRSRRSTA